MKFIALIAFIFNLSFLPAAHAETDKVLVAGCIASLGIVAGGMTIFTKYAFLQPKYNRAMQLAKKLKPHHLKAKDAFESLKYKFKDFEMAASPAYVGIYFGTPLALMVCGWEIKKALDASKDPVTALQKDPEFRALSEGLGTDKALQIAEMKVKGKTGEEIVIALANEGSHTEAPKAEATIVD